MHAIFFALSLNTVHYINVNNYENTVYPSAHIVDQ
jgi:hypothetical protein